MAQAAGGSTGAGTLAAALAAAVPPAPCRAPLLPRPESSAAFCCHHGAATRARLPGGSSVMLELHMTWHTRQKANRQVLRFGSGSSRPPSTKGSGRSAKQSKMKAAAAAYFVCAESRGNTKQNARNIILSACMTVASL